MIGQHMVMIHTAAKQQDNSEESKVDVDGSLNSEKVDARDDVSEQ